MLRSHCQAQSTVQLVAADPRKVIATGVEEQVLQVVPRIVQRRGIAGPHLAEELQQAFLRVPGGILLQGHLDVAMVGHGVHCREEPQNLLVGSLLHQIVGGIIRHVEGSQRPQEARHRNLPAAVDLDGDDVLLRGLEFEPCATVGNQLGQAEEATRGSVLLNREVDP